jgi:hypothetical protein
LPSDTAAARGTLVPISLPTNFAFAMSTEKLAFLQNFYTDVTLYVPAETAVAPAAPAAPVAAVTPVAQPAPAAVAPAVPPV